MIHARVSVICWLKANQSFSVDLNFCATQINRDEKRRTVKCILTAIISMICRAPPAALFSGGNASAEAHVSLRRARATVPPPFKIFGLMIKVGVEMKDKDSGVKGEICWRLQEYKIADAFKLLAVLVGCHDRFFVVVNNDGIKVNTLAVPFEAAL